MNINEAITKEANLFLKGGGEMGALTREFNWSATSLGSPEKWPLSLKTTLGILLHSAFPMFLFWGEDLTCFYNDAYRPSLGIDGKHPAVGKNAKEVWPDIWEFIRPLIEGVMKTGESVWFEDQYLPIYRNGRMEEVYWTFSYSAAYDDNGTIAGVFVTCTETTHKLKLLENLTASEKRFKGSEFRIRSLVESAPFPIGVYAGKEMIVMLANQAILDVWDKGSDVIGKSYFDILPELRDQAIFEQLDDVYKHGIPFHAKNQRVNIDVEGELRSYYFNYSFIPLYDADGEIYGVMNTAADVTDLNVAKQRVEESGQALRNIIAKAPVAMCILKGADHTVEIANERMITIWGKTAGEVIDKPILLGLPEITGQGFIELLDNVLYTGETFIGQGIPILLPRGDKIETVFVNFIYEAYREPDNEVSGIFVVATDVTAQLLAIRQMEQSEHELTEIKNRLEAELEAGKQLQKQKDDFIGIASHELKTPLTALKSSMQLLGRWLKDDATPKVQQLIHLSNTSISKLNNLLEELLNDTKINEGQLVLSKSNFLVADAVNECADHLRIAGNQHIIIAGDPLIAVAADRQRIDQVIINLLNNAIKYAPQSASIIVNLEELPGKVKVSVTDQGPGILPEKIPHLFKRYYRVDTSGIQYSGLGLGLFIAAEIIRRHEGEIGVTSDLGKGSSFWFTIPAIAQ